jgi:RNA polymerase sigma factor (sigma-70 family)
MLKMEIVSNYSDAELLKVIKNEHNLDGVIKYLYRSHFLKANIYIKQNSGNDEDAEDIFQEVIINFIQLVQKDKFRGDSSVGTFMYVLIRNTWLNELKKRKRSKFREEKFEDEKVKSETDAGEHIINREIKNQIVELIESLGENCKKILLAFYYDNLSIQEILLHLHYENEQVVRNKKYKCLQKLQEIMALKPHIAKNLKSILLYES